MNKAEQLASLVRNAKHMVVLTGAGMSTESGIPDFVHLRAYGRNMIRLPFRMLIQLIMTMMPFIAFTDSESHSSSRIFRLMKDITY
ncbi:hypothetical protein ACFQDF_08620 [Ectobacillus funiculus]